ncbi:hypothetical protein [Agrococcus sp. DT81.2]|uniref:hypothetical protein n=1 Tax=Agrococcus sp. DT81.2 TaxID=3393414 RepID=UPI003CE5A668
MSDHPTQHAVYSAADIAEVLEELRACGADPLNLRRWAARRDVHTALVRAGRTLSSVRLPGKAPGGGWVEFALVEGAWARTL